jgi:cytochrome c-type biogenesis protein CcmF
MNVQLALFVFVFLAPAYVLFIARYKRIPHVVKEEATDSREFWMFIGSLILFLGAMFIIIFTSLPIYNKIVSPEKKLNTGDDQTFSYNRIMIFVAILIGVLTAVTQYLKYKGTTRGWLLKKIGVPTVVAVVVAVLIDVFGGVHYDRYGNGFLAAIYLALFCVIYAVVANAAYIWIGMNGKLRAAGGSIAHFGFGLMLLGILLSSAKKQVLSFNTTGITLNFRPEDKQDPMENLTLLKGTRTDMGRYWATYVGNDSVDQRQRITYYQIHMEKKDGSEQFDLYPDFLYSVKTQDQPSANPDKKHYWDRDLFSYITATNPLDRQDTASFRSAVMALRDTAYYSRGYVVLDSILVNPNNGKFHFGRGDTALVARMTVVSRDSMRYTAYPAFYVKGNTPYYLNDTVFAQDLALRFNTITKDQKFDMGIKESTDMVPFIALKVLEFPQIALVWLGVIIMATGFVISLLWRRRQAKLATA